MKIHHKAFISLVVAHVLGLAVMWAVGSQSPVVAGLPVTLWLFVGIYAIQWIAYVPAYIKQTESFFDFTGGLTYILAVVGALLLTGGWQWHQIIATVMVVIWASRLGIFLFQRVLREGKDGRFDELKTHPIRYLNVWSVQGLWVTLTSLAALVVIMTPDPVSLSWLHVAGFAIWLAGFGIEAIADDQKKQFRKDPANKGRFIDSGLWAMSRHPNYVGEITLWTGVAVFAIPMLSGWQWLALISPVFVFVLLNYISGVPLLEKRADERWGDDADYVRYKEQTPVLFPGFGTNSRKQQVME